MCVVPYDSYTPKLFNLGCHVHSIKLNPRSKNIFSDLFLLFQYLYIFLRFKPDVYLGFTIKPNIYGSLICSFLRILYVNNIAGLGQTFSSSGLFKDVICKLYKLSLSNSSHVFFQNNTDKDIFISNGLISKYITSVLPGSGINTDKFNLVPLPTCKRLRFSLISRLLWDKGIKEFEEVACIIQNKGYDVEFYLFGFTDNTTGSVSSAELDKIISKGNIIYGGKTDNVYDEIKNSHCIVLPTFYNEGTPRVLLEGSSMGRPLITTNTKGCRDVVTHGINGFLCKPRNSLDLANQVEKIILMDSDKRTQMGLRGREKILSHYDEKFVLQKYHEVISKLQSFEGIIPYEEPSL
jgi:glycosyltransferase involved in cell wall biosynthesis